VNEVLGLVSSFAVSTFVAFALVGFDERRLARTRPDLAARGWPPASKTCALVVFGPLALVVHFVRTRRSLGGVVLGLLAAAVVLAASAVDLAGVDLLSPGLPAPTSMDHGALR
jgi:hypothetical protein